MERWKATEFRQFMLYSGPVALKDVLSDERYNNFLLLFVNIYCLSSPSYVVSHCQYAHELLCFFVHEFGNLYGRDMLVYNVHGIVHLAQDARRFGTLQSLSAFPFESFLGRLKKKIRKPTCPLQQIIRRLSEERHHLSHSVNLTPPSVPKREHIEGPLPFEFNNFAQFKEIYRNLHLSTSCGNNCVGVGSKCGLIRNILAPDVGNDYVILFEPFSEVLPFFTTPLNSSDIGILLVSGLNNRVQMASLSEICCAAIQRQICAQSSFASIYLIKTLNRFNSLGVFIQVYQTGLLI